MLKRHLGLVRACSAVGLLTSSLLGTVASSFGADAGANSGVGQSSVKLESISILDAQAAGDLAVKARGNGQYHVNLTLKNTTSKRLSVVIPPGLVASSVAGQGRGGGGAFQSMGLGSVKNAPGSFGEFRGAGLSKDSSFRSVGISPETDRAIAVPAGETVEVAMPSVCLNYGMPTPGPKQSFELVSVEDYTKDTRIHKALKSLVALGTSQGVAQAAMWRVCNDVPFDVMDKEPAKVMNSYEIALAKRFVDALDLSGSSELVDQSYLTEGRVFVRVQGDGAMAADTERLAAAVEGQKILGLTAKTLRPENDPKIQGPALLFDIVVTSTKANETRSRVVMSLMADDRGWQPIGKFALVEKSGLNAIDGEQLADKLDRTIAATYVTMKPAARGKGVVSYKVDNRLPFTIGSLSVKTGESLGSVVVPFNGVGVAPARSATFGLQAPVAIVEHVELNGL